MVPGRGTLVVERERAVVVVDRDDARSKRPSAMAPGPAWLSTASVAVLAGEALEVAIRSAEMPWGDHAGTGRAGAGCWPVKPSAWAAAGRDIDSTPPATTRSWSRRRIAVAAKLTACWPEPQKRLSVTPGASSRPPGVEGGHTGDVHAVVTRLRRSP